MSPKRNSEKAKIFFRGKVKDDFLSDVRKRTEEYFKQNNTQKTANFTIHLKGIILLASCLLLYFILLFGWIPEIPRILIWALFGVNQALFAVNVGHDANHGCYTKSSIINKLIGFVGYDCIGLNSYIWKQTHNREHHTFTNIAGADPDIDKPGLLRLSKHAPHYSIHKYQHLYIWFLYSLVSINWILFSDYVYFWKKRKEFPWDETLYFFFFKAFNLFVLILAPLLFSPMAWWQVVIGYLVMQFFGGFTVAIIFQLAHLVENVDFPIPDEKGVVFNTWGAHEMATTANFATKNTFVTHLLGGLNFQIEHHLLPKISHCHYQRLSKIVKTCAKEHGLPYHELPTMLSAIASHARYLKKLGNNYGEKE